MPLPVKKAAGKVAAGGSVNFGDINMYVAGAAIPEGNYACSFQVMMEQETENYRPKVKRIGVQLTAHSLPDGKEVKTKFLAWGSKAHEVFVPSADGMGVDLKAGAQGAATIPSSSNWGIFIKSLLDCGLPNGIFSNNVGVLNGIHVHLANVPESEERKGFKNKKAATSEVAEEPVFAGGGTTLNVTEILGLGEGGTPWEGGGGIPDGTEAAAPVATAPVKKGLPTASPAAKAAAAKKAAEEAAAAAAAEAEGPTVEELMEAAVAACGTVLETSPKGCTKLLMRTGAFKAANAAYDEDTATAIISTFFDAGDEMLNSVLEQLGYVVNGSKIEVAPA